MNTNNPTDLARPLGQTEAGKEALPKKADIQKNDTKPRKSTITLPFGYRSMFDEFDEGPLLEQDLSDDFVDEVRKREKVTRDGPLTINLRLAGELRDKSTEAMISTRLRDYFVSQHEDHSAKFKWKRKLGVFLIISGLVAEAIVANAFYSYLPMGFLSQIPDRIFTLLGYGGFFFGVERVLEAYSGIDDLRFFMRMSEAKIVFRDINPKAPKSEAKEPESSTQPPQSA